MANVLSIQTKQTVPSNNNSTLTVVAVCNNNNKSVTLRINETKTEKNYDTWSAIGGGVVGRWSIVVSGVKIPNLDISLGYS
ncbi:hypothetical protein HDU92_001202 [Lobulomyces angularis]|nr:hypothetical protein HDU92_001202 [Lobulomyces angularis]